METLISTNNNHTSYQIPKKATGIKGLDEITGGGLPAKRPTLVCGYAGCGKTMMAIQFIINGIKYNNEPGVFITFEETDDEIINNFSSLNNDIPKLQKENKLYIEHIKVDRQQLVATGNYDLEALFIRLQDAIDRVGAKRIALDTLELLFWDLDNPKVLRSELRRLFQWLKEKQITVIATAESIDNKLTRNGLEEFVTDCVIMLDHRVINDIYTRQMRVVKYRGSWHGTNEYPFLIDKDGISILPITSFISQKEISNDIISTGISDLDDKLGKSGYYKGSAILVSGSAGTGKTSIAASFSMGTARNNKKCIYFSFEESDLQLKRNLKSIGLDLDKVQKNKKLKIVCIRPSLHGLEMHLAYIKQNIADLKPDAIILDPITNLTKAGTKLEVRGMLLRLLDFLKGNSITTIITALTYACNEGFDLGVSSLVDTWISLKMIENEKEKKNGLHIVKSRGMSHSRKIHELLFTEEGLKLL